MKLMCFLFLGRRNCLFNFLIGNDIYYITIRDLGMMFYNAKHTEVLNSGGEKFLVTKVLRKTTEIEDIQDSY